MIGKTKFAWLALVAAALLAGPAPADDKKENTAVKPSPKDEARHKGFVDIAKKGDVDVVLFGDSITDGWRGGPGKDVWKEHFEPLKAANFGIGGDRTQHVLWRMENGELEGYKPKAMVLMIGTNNLTANSVEEIAEGITACVKDFEKAHPKAKVLLLGIFPRGAKADDANRKKIADINAIIAKLDDGKKVHYLDIGEKFLEKDGSISKEVMPNTVRHSSCCAARPALSCCPGALFSPFGTLAAVLPFAIRPCCRFGSGIAEAVHGS